MEPKPYSPPPPVGRTLRIFLQTVGFISLALGFAGAFLPLLPTTPFILLSAWCFARSSPKWHAWLHQHQEFGPLIENWNRDRSVSLRHKQMASLMVLISIATIWYANTPTMVRYGLTGGLSFLLAMLFIVKTAPPRHPAKRD